MGSQKIILIVVGVLIVGGGVWYFTQNSEMERGVGSSDVAKEEDDNRSLGESIKDSFSGVGSFAELLARRDSFRCDFEAEEDDNYSKGTVYFDGKGERFAATGEHKTGGEEGTFGMITTGEVAYIWGETPEGKQGIKVVAPEGENFMDDEDFNTPRGGDQPYGGSPVGMDENVSYDCDPWRVDASVFVPPRDVEFMDMQKMFEDMMGSMPEGFEMPEGVPVAQ